MTGKGHNWAGVALIPAVYYETYSTFHNHIVSLIACLFLISGATAPDWLEIRKKSGGTIITHRTITHWLPIWIGLYVFSIFMMNTPQFNIFEYAINSNQYIAASLLGFTVGGLLHLAVDFPNPMGIPVLTPYHRLSLNLWKSGRNEGFIISCLVIFSFFYVGISSGVVSVDWELLISNLKAL